MPLLDKTAVFAVLDTYHDKLLLEMGNKDHALAYRASREQRRQAVLNVMTDMRNVPDVPDATDKKAAQPDKKPLLMLLREMEDMVGAEANRLLRLFQATEDDSVEERHAKIRHEEFISFRAKIDGLILKAKAVEL